MSHDTAGIFRRAELKHPGRSAEDNTRALPIPGWGLLNVLTLGKH